MKFLKTALILSAMAAMVALSGCTACDNTNTSSSMPSTSSSSPSTSSSLPSESGSVLPSDGSSALDNDDNTSSNSDHSTSSSTVPTLSTDFSEIGALDGSLVKWGPGTHRDGRNRPSDLDPLQEKYEKYNCWFIGKEKGKIYLTFDEGYENGYTEKILDVLKDKDVKAIFFVTGHYVKSNPELVQRMIDEGHMVGNHSDKHPVNGGYTTLPIDAVQDDVMSLHNMVKEQFGYDMSVFRYPEGAFSEQTAALLGKMGYKQLFWSFAYNDWNADKQPDPAEARKKIVDSAHDGAIYLLHAVSSTNTAVLPDVIDELRGKGYEFALFDESIETN